MDSKTGKRKIYLDILRIMAILMVLFNHRVAYYCIETPQPLSLNYIIKILLSVFAKCGPPLFFMISGYLLLGREEDIKRIFTHRILRIIIVMAVCALYFVFRFKDIHIKLNWYFYAYLAFLFILPFLRKIAIHADKKQIVYFLVIAGIAYYASGIYRMLTLHPNVVSAVETFGMNFMTSKHPSNCWPVIFPLLGFFLGNLEKKGFTAQERRIIFVLFFVFSILTCFINIPQILWAVASADPSHNTEMMRQYFIFAPCCLIFLTAGIISEKSNICISDRLSGIISQTGAATFGMFVIETQTTFSLTIYGWIEDHTASFLGYYFPSLVSVAAEFVIYAAVVIILRRIPLIRKVL